MRLIRTALCVVLVVVPVDPVRTVVHRHHHRDDQGHERRQYPARHHHHHESADQQAGVGRDGPRGPVHVAAAAARRVPRRGGPAGLPPRGAHDVTVQINSTVVIDFTLEVGDLTDQVEVRADATLLETSSGTVGKLVDNRRILELPLNTRNVYSLIFLTPGVAGIDRQQLQLDELHRQRRAADDDGYGHRRGDGVLPDRQRVHGHFGVPVGRRDPGVQGARRELPGRIRPQPRQRPERRLQVGHQPVPRQRLRVLPRLGVRLEQLLREAGRARRSAISSAASSAASPAARSGAAGPSS